MPDTQKMTRPGGNLGGSVKQKHLANIHSTPLVERQTSLWASNAIAAALQLIIPAHREPVFVCVGTDRSTGDAYGPLVGTALSRACPDVTVYGTLWVPVHALNLDGAREHLVANHPDAFVVAIDSCLGKYDDVGAVQISRGPLRPGAGVGRDLEEIGDCNVLGVVNAAGFMENLVLQNTRLAVVADLVEYTVDGLTQFLRTREGQAEAAAASS